MELENKIVDKKLILGYKRMALISVLISSLLGISFFFTVGTPHLALNIFLWYVGTVVGLYYSPKIYFKIWKNK